MIFFFLVAQGRNTDDVVVSKKHRRCRCFKDAKLLTDFSSAMKRFQNANVS